MPSEKIKSLKTAARKTCKTQTDRKRIFGKYKRKINRTAQSNRRTRKRFI